MEQHLATCPDCLLLVENAGRASSVALDSTVFPGLDDTCPPVEPETRVGRYIVRSGVGAGAMGRVYAAYDPTLDREVALKLLHPSAGSAHLEARLLREAKAMARLAHHPEVVPVYDAGRHGAQLFIAMEFVEGGTLRAWLATRPRSWREIVAVFQRAGRGLAHAHARGLVHRDFKPDNVLVGRDGRVRVTDFGLARVLRDVADAAPISSGPTHRAGARRAVDASLTRTGTLVGTPAYMAPEQLDGGNADARSDIFSFCVALYEALYGERPFKGSTVAQLRDVTSRGRISPPRGDRGVPRGLGRALRMGLRPRSEDRHASMAALLEAVEPSNARSKPLGPTLRHRGIPARSGGGPRRRTTPAERPRRGSGGVLRYGRSRDPEQRDRDTGPEPPGSDCAGRRDLRARSPRALGDRRHDGRAWRRLFAARAGPRATGRATEAGPAPTPGSGHRHSGSHPNTVGKARLQSQLLLRQERQEALQSRML